jgi:flagellar motor switch protein FliG
MKDGLQKSAILLMAMGEEAAAEVFKQLGPKQVQAIVAEIAKLKTVTKDAVAEAAQQFVDDVESASPLVPDPNAYARTVAERALGPETTSLFVDRVLGERETAAIEQLRWMDGVSIAELVVHEHPQVIAALLSHLENDHAAQILTNFSDELRSDVVTRIANLTTVQPLALADLNDALERLIAAKSSVKKIKLGGLKMAAGILNLLGKNNQKILENIGEKDPDLFQKLSDQMFVFADLLKLDDKGIQVLLREISSDALIIAMKGCEPELRDKFLKNMSQRAAESLREDLESKGPVKLADVEKQHREILVIVKRLADDGQLTLASAGEEAAFV